MKDWDLLVEDVREIKTTVKETNKAVQDQALTLARNTESLIHHSARTAANEDRILQVERWLLGFLASIVLAFIYYIVRR